MDKGYYWASFYNHDKRMILYFNGLGFESFPSDATPHDEIDPNSIKPVEKDNL